MNGRVIKLVLVNRNELLTPVPRLFPDFSLLPPRFIPDPLHCLFLFKYPLPSRYHLNFLPLSFLPLCTLILTLAL